MRLNMSEDEYYLCETTPDSSSCGEMSRESELSGTKTKSCAIVYIRNRVNVTIVVEKMVKKRGGGGGVGFAVKSLTAG